MPFVEEKNFVAVENFCAAHDLTICALGATLKTVTACQGVELCRSGIVDAPKFARELERRHGEKFFPTKFLIGVTGCPNNCMKVETNDLGIVGAIVPVHDAAVCDFCGACEKVCPVGALTVDREKNLWALGENCRHCGRCVKRCTASALRGEVGYKIFFGGEEIFHVVRDETSLYEIVDALINFFVEHAHKGERPKNFLTRVGVDELIKNSRS